MKKLFNSLWSNPLIQGSFVVFLGSLLGSFVHYLFGLYMLSTLPVEESGIVYSINSFVLLPGLAAGALVPIVVNFAATFYAEGEIEKVRGLFLKLTKAVGIITSLLFIFLILFTFQLSEFFKIPDITLFIIADFIISLNIFMIINVSFLQAKLAFKTGVLLGIITAVIKLGVGILLIGMGFGARGAIIALFFSFLLPYLVSFFYLKEIFQNNTSSVAIPTKDLLRYGIPSAITLLSLNLFITNDIFLVKHFFDAKTAGLYAGLSQVGKVIFFFSVPIGTVMFPLIVQKHAKKENYTGVFFLSLLAVFLLSFSIAVFYFLFPEFSIRFFIKNEEYVKAASLLGLFGLFMAIFSLVTVIVNYFLSIKKMYVVIPVLCGALLHSVLIWFMHESVKQVISISLIVVSLLLFSLLLYYVYLFAKKNDGIPKGSMNSGVAYPYGKEKKR